MQEHADIARNHTTALRVIMFNALCLRFPVAQALWGMRVRDHTRRPTRRHAHLLVLEQRVRHRDDQPLLQEWPVGEYSLSDHLRRDLLRTLAPVRILNVHDHRLVAALCPVHVDSVVAEHRGVWQCLQRGEAGKRVRAEGDTVAQARDEVQALEYREIEGLHGACAAVERREEPGERRWIKRGLAGIESELGARSERIALFFLRCQPVFAS